MRKMVIYLNEYQRVVVYKEGGYQTEEKVNGIGWVLNNDIDCKAALKEAQIVLNDAASRP
jgi:hypothetical protein